MENLKDARISLRLSQSALARIAGVPRVHICLYELGDRPLTKGEAKQVHAAIGREAGRLRAVLESLV